MSTKGLLSALLAVQQEAPPLPKDATNPHFKSKYTSLDTIVDTLQPILAKHGLVWTAMPCCDAQGSPALRYRLSHAETGEVLEDTMPLLLTKNDPQGMGSALTYARRYSLSAVLNLVADSDDDGNGATKPRTITADRAHQLADLATTLGEQDKLMERALSKLTEAEAAKVEQWLNRKADTNADAIVKKAEEVFA